MAQDDEDQAVSTKKPRQEPKLATEPSIIAKLEPSQLDVHTSDGLPVGPAGDGLKPVPEALADTMRGSDGQEADQSDRRRKVSAVDVGRSEGADQSVPAIINQEQPPLMLAQSGGAAVAEPAVPEDATDPVTQQPPATKKQRALPTAESQPVQETTLQLGKPSSALTLLAAEGIPLALKPRVSSSTGADTAATLGLLAAPARASDPGTSQVFGLRADAVPLESAINRSSNPAHGSTNIDELLQLIRGHPDSEAAVAAALSAVQRLKRAAPSSSAGSQPGGAAKRAATNTAHADTQAGQLGSQAPRAAPLELNPLTRDGVNGEGGKTSKHIGGTVLSTSLAPLTLNPTTDARSQAGPSQAPGQAGQTFVVGANGQPASAAAGATVQQGQGKSKKPRSKASAEPTPLAPGAAAGTAAADAEPAAAAATVAPAAAAPAPAVAPIPDMATYLEGFPRCKQLINMVRGTPNNSTKTPLALVNEYAARLTLEVVWGEDADSAAGPYTATCTLQSRLGQVRHAHGSGRGRNKRDARQVAAASCAEVLLGPQHNVQFSDFTAPAKPPGGHQKRDMTKPGLGFAAAGGAGAANRAGGIKKRRDGEGGSNMGSMRPSGGAGGGQNGPPGGLTRPIAFTRAVLPSSLPGYNRRDDRQDDRQGSNRSGGGAGSGSRPYMYDGQQRGRPADRSGGGAGTGSEGGHEDGRPGGNAYRPHPGDGRQGYERYPGQQHDGSSGRSGGDASNSSFGMHSLQAILPPTPDTMGGLHHKRDYSTAMLNHHTAGGGALDMSGLHGSLDATLFNTASQLLQQQALQQQAAAVVAAVSAQAPWASAGAPAGPGQSLLDPQYNPAPPLYPPQYQNAAGQTYSPTAPSTENHGSAGYHPSGYAPSVYGPMLSAANYAQQQQQQQPQQPTLPPQQQQHQPQQPAVGLSNGGGVGGGYGGHDHRPNTSGGGAAEGPGWSPWSLWGNTAAPGQQNTWAPQG